MRESTPYSQRECYFNRMRLDNYFIAPTFKVWYLYWYCLDKDEQAKELVIYATFREDLDIATLECWQCERTATLMNASHLVRTPEISDFWGCPPGRSPSVFMRPALNSEKQLRSALNALIRRFSSRYIGWLTAFQTCRRCSRRGSPSTKPLLRSMMSGLGYMLQ